MLNHSDFLNQEETMGTKQKAMKYYKILYNGRACHGGDYAYPLPVRREDGTWEPGEWTPTEQHPSLRERGYHLTREPARWWVPGAECYEAEWGGAVDGDGGDTIAVERCRLLRRLTAEELVGVRVFVAGAHTVRDSCCAACGAARVRAYDKASVEAYDSASVEAYDSASVRACGSGNVVVCGSASVEAYDSASVEAYGSANVLAYGSASVRAYDAASVRAYGSASVRAYDAASVRAYGSASVEAHDSASVLAYGSANVLAYDSAGVRAYGSASVRAYSSALVRTIRGAWGAPTVTVSGHAVWVDERSGAPRVYTAAGELAPPTTTEAPDVHR